MFSVSLKFIIFPSSLRSTTKLSLPSAFTSKSLASIWNSIRRKSRLELLITSEWLRILNNEGFTINASGSQAPPQLILESFKKSQDEELFSLLKQVNYDISPLEQTFKRFNRVWLQLLRVIVVLSLASKPLWSNRSDYLACVNGFLRFQGKRGLQEGGL